MNSSQEVAWAAQILERGGSVLIFAPLCVASQTVAEAEKMGVTVRYVREIPDYVVTFRKPGTNTKPVAHEPEEFPVNEWQQLASPCWMDIKQSNTLNRKGAREDDDERHVCPLQLDLIQRCIRLWSTHGDVVFSPFTGIGSEGHVALKMGRKFVGAELKRSYFELATRTLKETRRDRSWDRIAFALPEKEELSPALQVETDDPQRCILDFFSADTIEESEAAE